MCPIFKQTSWPISSLVDWVKTNLIWLPNLQRWYVWERTRVRNLFDSLYKGYPTGMIMLLSNDTTEGVKPIWWNSLSKIPSYSVIDGQQRLTSLYAAITWGEVKKQDWSYSKIVISFNPLKETFEVADAWTKWADWIYDIKDIIAGNNLIQICTDYVSSYKARAQENNTPEEEIIPDNVIFERIQKVSNIKNESFICIEIFKETPVEVVSDIFLRINSWWIKLNNSDFILTLMSVYWGEGKQKIEDFSIWTKDKNDIVWLPADDTVRVLMWVWLKRARLDQIYNYLRWQIDGFDKLSKVIDTVTNKAYWSDYLTILKDAWFISNSLITQSSLIVACYIFYLIWLKEHNLNFQELAPVIKKYYIAMLLTWKYVNSMETTLWKDLSALETKKTKEEFLEFFENEVNLHLTPDSWNVKFKNDIKTDSARAPLSVVYNAALIYFHKPVLFKTIPVSKFFLDMKDGKSEIDSHHIFPKQYLIDNFWDKLKQKDINQIANKVWAYNKDNKFISKKAPAEYYDEFSQWWKISWAENLKDNCIPSNFYELEYEQFLESRRELMLQLIRDYYEDICNPSWRWKVEEPITTTILWWESRIVEFKSSYRWDYHQNKADNNIKFQVMKTLAAFLNSDWWTLFVWVKDDWEILWLDNDINSYQEKSWDALLKDIDNMIRDNFGNFKALIDIRREKIEEKSILVFRIGKAHQPAYFVHNWEKVFYVRNAASSTKLEVEEAHNYINEHF